MHARGLHCRVLESARTFRELGVGITLLPHGMRELRALGLEDRLRALGIENPDKTVVFLDRTVCFCATMNRIDLPHLVWAMENLLNGQVVNRISVDPDDAKWARVALERMLQIA